MLHIGPVSWPPISRIASLDDRILVMLLQVVRQGWVDAASVARQFQVLPAQAEARLARLRHLGLLQSEGARFVIAPHLRGAVQRALKERGWLE